MTMTPMFLKVDRRQLVESEQTTEKSCTANRLDRLRKQTDEVYKINTKTDNQNVS